MMSSASRNVKFPPEIPTCPDYWEAKEQSESLAGEIMHQPQSICVPNPDLGDKSNMGTFIDKEMDFSPSQYQGPSGIAEKCLWANSHNVFWSGVTDMGSCQKLRPNMT